MDTHPIAGRKKREVGRLARTRGEPLTALLSRGLVKPVSAPPTYHVCRGVCGVRCGQLSLMPLGTRVGAGRTLIDNPAQFYSLAVMSNTSSPLVERLRKAVTISEQIQKLQAELDAILSGCGMGNGDFSDSAAVRQQRRTRKMSAAGRRRIAAAQRARWAKAKGEATAADYEQPVVRKKRRKMSAAGRAAIAAAQKKRWAKAKEEA